MLKNVIFIYISFLSLATYADTLDYWSVYLNDSLIGKYNTLSTDNFLALKRAEIDSNDVLSFFYGNDHPCTMCEYYYAVADVKGGTKIHTDRKLKLLQEVEFPLIKLKTFRTNNEFEFSIYENRLTTDDYGYVKLFILKIE